MASIFGHAISIVGFKKLFPDKHFGRKILLLGVVSSIIPDIDVISESFGITSLDEFGFLAHRGFTHSILFAIVWALIVLTIFHKKSKENVFLIGVFYFFCTISHGILDSMTNGGDGIIFFLPFDLNRYFFPYRFIEVSPIGIGSFFSEWGLEVLWSEFKYIAVPSLIFYSLGYLINKKCYP